MAWRQVLIDNFSAASLNTNRWSVAGGGSVTQTGGTLQIKKAAGVTTGTSFVQTYKGFDIGKGILAVKLTKSGTPANYDGFRIGLMDYQFYSGAWHWGYITFTGEYGNTSMFLEAFNDAGAGVINPLSVSNLVWTDTTGFGSGWVNNTWIGIGNLGSDGIIHVYKSTDGVTWTEMVRGLISGAFDKANSAGFLEAGSWKATTLTSNMTSVLDDYSWWTQSPPVIKKRVGGAWVGVKSPTPVRVGGTWTPARLKVRTGGAWKRLM